MPGPAIRSGRGVAPKRDQAVADETLGKDEAYATIVTGGTRHDIHIAHASGTAANPMWTPPIEAKFMANATPAIGKERAEQVRDLVWGLERVDDARVLIEMLR